MPSELHEFGSVRFLYKALRELGHCYTFCPFPGLCDLFFCSRHLNPGSSFGSKVCPADPIHSQRDFLGHKQYSQGTIQLAKSLIPQPLYLYSMIL